MPKPTSHAEATPIRVVIVTLDSHLDGTAERALPGLKRAIPGLELNLHSASEWATNPDSLERCKQDVAKGDVIMATMLFMEEHINPILPALKARRDACDAMVGCMSGGEVIRMTRLGRFDMGKREAGVLNALKHLRGSRKSKKSSGARQMAMLRRLPRILRFIPGTAQDMRAYFLTMQYWLACSDDNFANMIRFLVDRYASGPRKALRGKVGAAPPADYPEVGVYHPRMKSRIADRRTRLPSKRGNCGTVGLILMRSYVLSGDTAHYDGVIEALEARGFHVVPAFAGGLDARPAIEKFFIDGDRSTVDAVISLTGFSLVGGPAYNDAKAAEEMLARLDVPYLAAHALEFQSLEQWNASDQGLLPIEATMMVAIPELDGSTGPVVFGGRAAETGTGQPRNMQTDTDRSAMLASRVERLVALRTAKKSERRIAVVLYNFPPNAGSTGSAAHLSVFASLHRTLLALRDDGYTVDVPETVDALRDAIINGNAATYGTEANVFDRVSVDDHVRREPWLSEIEQQWGPAPGRQQSDGGSIFVLGQSFGNVFVGIQPAFGYEGDPMRLLFEKGFAPTHAFCAFYRFLSDDFDAHAVLHFGTHGALEFMPGKQSGLTAACWPDRLIGDLPNFYLYAANNPSEGTIAKRRSAATLISYLTPPVTNAGLYRGLLDLKASIDRWRGLAPGAKAERLQLTEVIQSQAAALDLVDADPVWADDSAERVRALGEQILELEYALIPHGLHVFGQPLKAEERVDLLLSMATASHGASFERPVIEALVNGAAPSKALAQQAGKPGKQDAALLKDLQDTDRLLAADNESPALLHALDGGFVRPSPGGDLLRTPEILPTGRNIHGFDPFRIPSGFAVEAGTLQASALLERHMSDGNDLPESVALVLWGTDNLKTEGGPIAQALALLGARPRFDSYGRLAGAELMDLETLGRPRVDVVMTLSGIFRDLLPLQTRMLAEAALLAASADEPVTLNFVRKHALAYQEANDCDLETAALRVFSNADGAYGSNVNHLIDSGCWSDEDELADTYQQRKCFAYGRSGKPIKRPELLQSVLSDVDIAYQNLESVELGITTIDHYFDTLGGIGRAIRRSKGADAPVYIGDQTLGDAKVRTLSEQVALETRTRILNPKWYEGMLDHGYEGVRQIEAHVTNTLGWSATTGQVAPWVYQHITQTFVLDEEMRKRLATLNPKASVKVANRLLEAHERSYWKPDESTLEELRRAGEELEDRLEGLGVEAAA